MTSETMMRDGNEILAEVLRPAGFVLGRTRTAKGSGGMYSVARWTKGNQSIELHTRHALGIVLYGWGDQEFDHRHLVSALGVSNTYPGFSDDPLDGFRHLAVDLAGPLSVVLGAENRRALDLANEWIPPGRVLP